ARLQSCDDFRSLIPAYLSSSLTASRKLLFEDHMHECVLCRKALQQARGKMGSAPSRATGVNFSREHLATRGGRPHFPAGKWAAAAAVAVVVVLAFQTTVVRDFLWPIDVHAMVQTVDGGLYAVSGQQVRPIAAGERIERFQIVRTGNSSGEIGRAHV